jgi:hypothetical protein
MKAYGDTEKWLPTTYSSIVGNHFSGTRAGSSNGSQANIPQTTYIQICVYPNAGKYSLSDLFVDKAQTCTDRNQVLCLRNNGYLIGTIGSDRNHG